MLARRADRGVATVWAMALMSVLLIAALGSAAVAEHAWKRQRAQTAADLAALAAADAAGRGDACAQAQAVAARNAAQLLTCAVGRSADPSVLPPDVVVEVRVEPGPLVRRLAGLLGRQPPAATAESRAGPPSA